MKKIFILMMLFICNYLYSQAFFTKLYFETAQGEKDSLVVGYDPAATDGIDPAFGEIVYNFPINPDNKFQAFIIDPWMDCYTEGFPYLKKQIISIEEGINDARKIIGIIIPEESFPVTVSWNENSSKKKEYEYCIFTNEQIDLFNNKLYINWKTIQKKDLNKKDSIIFSNATAFHYYYPSNGTNSAISFNIIYLGFLNPDKYFSANKVLIDDTFSIFPNPVTDFCRIEKKSSDIIQQIHVFSISGKKLIHLNGDISEIDCSELTKGLYIVEITKENNKTYYHKLIKK